MKRENTTDRARKYTRRGKDMSTSFSEYLCQCTYQANCFSKAITHTGKGGGSTTDSATASLSYNALRLNCTVQYTSATSHFSVQLYDKARLVKERPSFSSLRHNCLLLLVSIPNTYRGDIRYPPRQQVPGKQRHRDEDFSARSLRIVA